MVRPKFCAVLALFLTSGLSRLSACDSFHSCHALFAACCKGYAWIRSAPHDKPGLIADVGSPSGAY
jgi:hypothetical protein